MALRLTRASVEKEETGKRTSDLVFGGIASRLPHKQR